MKLRFSLRSILFMTYIFLVLMTTSLMTYLSLDNYFFTTQNLTQQVVHQTGKQLEEKLNSLFHKASLETKYIQQLMETNEQHPKQVLKGLKVFSKIHMESTKELAGSFIYWIEQEQVLGIIKRGGKLYNWNVIWDKTSNQWKEFLYPSNSSNNTPVIPKIHSSAFIANRPWVKLTKTIKKPGWTKSYLFNFQPQSKDKIAGITFSTPIYSADAKLQAIIGTDFVLKTIIGLVNLMAKDLNGEVYLIEHISNSSKILNKKTDSIIPLAKLKKLTNLKPHTLHEKTYNDQNYFIAVHELNFKNLPPWSIIFVLPQTPILYKVQEHLQQTLILFFLAIIVALLMAWPITKALEKTFYALIQQAKNLGQFNIKTLENPSSAIKEIDELYKITNQMQLNLKNFSKYLPVDLVRLLLSSNKEATLQGQKVNLTCLFTDIVHFGEICDEVPIETLLPQLGHYLESICSQISNSEGTIDKFIGDAVMAFWGAPIKVEDHEYKAALCALKIKKILEKSNQSSRMSFATRFGLHCGEMVVGNIGASDRFDYTVIGPNVNLANRLEGINKYYKTSIIVSAELNQKITRRLWTRKLDRVIVKGNAEVIEVYELRHQLEEVTSEERAFVELYESALEFYLQQNWDKAKEFFQKAIKLQSTDHPTQMMLVRCDEYKQNPPSATTWNGVYKIFY